MKHWWWRMSTILAAVTLSGIEAHAQSAGVAGVTSGSSLLTESVALFLSLACLLVTFKVYVSIRGGRVGRGWMWFVFAFSMLGIGQLLLFGGLLGFMPIPGGGLWTDLLRIVALAFLFVGVTRFRKLFA